MNKSSLSIYLQNHLVSALTEASKVQQTPQLYDHTVLYAEFDQWIDTTQELSHLLLESMTQDTRNLTTETQWREWVRANLSMTSEQAQDCLWSFLFGEEKPAESSSLTREQQVQKLYSMLVAYAHRHSSSDDKDYQLDGIAHAQRVLGLAGCLLIDPAAYPHILEAAITLDFIGPRQADEAGL